MREIRSLRRRVHALEERVEGQQETIVENVSRNWMRDAQYERLLRERNRLQARVSNLEDEIRRRRNNNDDNNNNRGSGSRERMVGFGFFGGN
jgi:chromosome segregation ATPase